MNWKAFELKNHERETEAFELMSYLLFCAEFDNRIGLFRYKNQTGIETEPIEKDGVYYGFQSKYYTTGIAANKDDILDSINKAKHKNNLINVIYLYINQELSESSDPEKKKPAYQIEIEAAATKIDVTVEWRVPSHFDLQLSLPVNKYIYDLFFNPDPSEGDLIDDVLRHNQTILRAIQTEIIYSAKKIRVDRSNIIDRIGAAIDNNENIIVSGEGGSGKTAVIKEYYHLSKNNVPICVFKASELNVNHINDLLRFDHNFSFRQFLDAYNSEPTKIFVIDSAEKLAELTNNDILTNLIYDLKEAGWTIIFTTRYSYLNDLSYHIKENYKLACEVIDIPLVSYDEINRISKEYDLILPENKTFLDRLRNLFYLNEYVQFYQSLDKQGSFNNFIDFLWKKRIQNNLIQKDNMHLERDRCLISIAKERSDTGCFFINGDELPQTALSHLKQDEILGYDDTHNGYFITHDIYEEWALRKIVSRNYSNHTNTEQFFDDLGVSLPIRRAFRLWLSDQLSENVGEIVTFVHETFTHDSIKQYWKDELLVSVLLSDYSEIFFKAYEGQIIAEGFKILKRILFLLRIACTDISIYADLEFHTPKGKGWEEAIALVYKHKADFFDNSINLVLPLLTDWCNVTKKGVTTRYAGLLVLSIIQRTETDQDYHVNDKTEEEILNIASNASFEIKSVLEELFYKVVTNDWKHRREPFNGFCSKILTKPYLATNLIRTLPLSVVSLCDLYWQKKERPRDIFDYDRYSMESKYGLDEHMRFDYIPASAFQTPIYWLLQSAFKETLDFVISFVNRSVETYRLSDYGKEDVEEIVLYIDDNEVSQYLCWAFWGMYRGIGSPNVPYLLESMHMALEKILLECSNKVKPDIVEWYLLYILRNSKSASLTSVVCSIVLAHPEKFYNVALVLFKSIELFHIDLMRSTNEFEAKSLYSIGYGLNRFKDVMYSDERLKTCEDKHRNTSLESLLLNYQMFGVNGFTEDQNAEFLEKLYMILDHLNVIDCQNKESGNNTWGIILARMDRRNLTPKFSELTDGRTMIEFEVNELPKELREQSVQVTKQTEGAFKYSSLRIWSDFFHSKTEQNTDLKVEQYNKDPHLALLDAKQLAEELEQGLRPWAMMDYSVPAFACAKLMIEYREILDKEEKAFCKEVILSSVSRLLADDYRYQISDGVEASIHAIPSLIFEYTEETEDFVYLLVITLFDYAEIGAYKRVCDYAIESVINTKLWDSSPTTAQAVLLSYIKLKPIYNSISEEQRKAQRKAQSYERILQSTTFQQLQSRVADISFLNLKYDVKGIDLLDIPSLEIVYQLIPSDTKNEILLDIYKRSLPLLSSGLLKDRRSRSKDDEDDESNIDMLRYRIFKRFAHFILLREIEEIDTYLNPFILSLDTTEETASFLDEIVVAEDYLKRYDQFTYIWNKIYSQIVEICNNPRGYYLNKVIMSYLLASQNCIASVSEWYSLNKDSLNIYSKISRDLGHVPAVLYSISKVLSSIGSNFQSVGIDWIYTIVSNNTSMKLGDLESDTLYYLERFLRKFIFNNKKNIKEEIRLKSKVIPILDFMIERSSIHGYLLRESVLM